MYHDGELLGISKAHRPGGRRGLSQTPMCLPLGDGAGLVAARARENAKDRTASAKLRRLQGGGVCGVLCRFDPVH